MKTTAAGRLTHSRRWMMLVGIGAILGLMVVRVEGAIALLAPTMFGVVLLAALVQMLNRRTDDATRRRILRWTMISFAAHLVFGLASTITSAQIRSYLGTDGIGYDLVARAVVRHWNSGLPLPFISSSKEGFYYMLAGLYWVFGSFTAAGLAVNAILAAGLVPVMRDLTDRLVGAAAARYAVPLVVAFPGLFLFTSQLLREAGMLFLMVVALNCAVRLAERVSLAPMAVLTSALILAFTFRSWVALILAAGLLVGLVLGHSDIAKGFAAGVGALAVVGSVMLASGLGYSGYKEATGVNLKQADTVRKDSAASANTGFANEADISSTPSALSYLPRGVVNFGFGPFPWEIHSARQVPFIPDMIVWWALLPSLWTGFVAGGRRVGRRRLLMVLPALGITLFMSLALGNFGIIVRERLQVLVLIVPLISLGLAERASKRAERHPVVVITVNAGLAPQA